MKPESHCVYLELSAEREHKFYEVTVEGAELTIRYGRIGTEGQTQRKSFADSAGAQAEAEKKLVEKRKKGYGDAVRGQTEKKAVEQPRLKLPRKFEPYRERIEATLRPALLLELLEEEPGPLGSKVGGVPYRVRGEAWPTDTEGRPLTFLAQLNFADLPPLEGYPESGILQFFIGRDDLYGCDFMRPEEGDLARFEVRWIPEPQMDLSQLDAETHVFDAADDDSPLETRRGFGLSGKRVEQPMSWCDCHFEQAIGLDLYDDSEGPEDMTLGEWQQKKYDELATYGHQVGGYPYFTQEDPRMPDDPRILLFQLDSEAGKIMWGDVGIANFFIHPDDLTRQDFSRVAYNWDCG